MFPVGVAWGFRDEPELIQSGAQVILHSPDELMSLLRHSG
jgi:phosphoglycolate phosphatase-like HAD superfamily hydrolase